ncbi:response regulator transcription factor [Anaerostipes sp.]|uniref:response regulator transcription factor n=1 Tax=Anaerostipes sp. TaxID=1872530 RepID=UPI0025BF32F7|nr:response regulator [Anaerostipes sp.]MBS7009032.1 response regulator [Anaerostipes sp.]
MKIVVVEDEKPIREGLSKIIPKLDHSYETAGSASTGSKGLDLIEKMKPEVILMDIQMPDMDGLAMLKKLREKKLRAKVIVLTAYSDFEYAQQSIELGVSKYLLKPMKIKELKEALEEIKGQLEKENRGKKLLSLDHIFQNCLNGHFEEEMAVMLKEKYSINHEKELYLLSFYLPENQKESNITALELIERLKQNTLFYFTVAKSEKNYYLILYYWKMSDIEEYIQNHVIPMFCENIKGDISFAWEKANNIMELQSARQRIKKLQEWNLVFEKGTLLTEEKIKKSQVCSMNYPVNLDHDIRKAVINADQKKMSECLNLFLRKCREKYYEPESIKEACIRCFWTIIHTMSEYGKKPGSELFVQKNMGALIRAVTWDEIKCVLKEEIGHIPVDKFSDKQKVKESTAAKAVRMIENYYSQGITLGEIADKLCVSEEYLSSQIKKETGSSFTVLIKEKRIREIKKLLVTTNLKLSQIAALAGYMDPKYMSKVFKEETGILPSEYRKTH